MDVMIRDAVESDLPVIVELLNALLGTTTYEYTDVEHTLAGRSEWFERQARRGFPVVVAESAGGVVGFAAYGDFRDSVVRPGYRTTVEHSVHVARPSWGGGVGRALMLELFERARAAGVHVMIGAIDSSNVDSIEFHARLGFVETGRLQEIATKFGRWLDLVLMQRFVEPPPPDP